MVLYEILKTNGRDSFKRQKIHLLGHSYGTKMISLASLEALRYYLPDTAIPANKENSPEISQEAPIESLVLMNAAFSPDDLNYLYDFQLWPVRWLPLKWLSNEKIHSLWSHIPRKAMVYTNTDYATGLFYDSSQIIFNNPHGQWVDMVIKSLYKDGRYIPVWSELHYLVASTGQLVWNIAGSAVYWTGRTVSSLPTDFAHHIVHNDTFGRSWAAKILNVPHYFLPLDKILIYPRGDNNFSHQQGFWRTTTPALGRTGLHNLRRESKDQFGVTNLFTREDTGGFKGFLDNDTDGRSNINAETFATMACSMERDSSEKPENFKNNLLFFSFDGSKVYDGWYPWVAGSHGDLREPDSVENCPGEKIEKREATFNFITKFTLGDRYPYTNTTPAYE